MPDKIEIFTDGACRGNPGPGGWAALLRFGSHEKILSGAEKETTNNRMELMAAIRALEAIQKSSQTIIVTTDSQYVQRGVSEWMMKWKKNGWRSAAKKTVKNIDLWQRLDKAIQHHQVEWHWVKGHSGHLENEKVDRLANEAIDAMLSQ